MYCYQCEQTFKGTGCTKLGVCGKDGRTAALQDLLVDVAKGVSMYAHRAAERGASDREIDRAVLDYLFATVTNVDFDPARLQGHLLDAARIRDKAGRFTSRPVPERAKSRDAFRPAAWQPPPIWTDSFGRRGGVDYQAAGRLGGDAAGLQELILYGLKGAAAYADHAHILGQEDPGCYATFHAGLDFLTRENPRPTSCSAGQ